MASGARGAHKSLDFRTLPSPPHTIMASTIFFAGGCTEERKGGEGDGGKREGERRWCGDYFERERERGRGKKRCSWKTGKLNPPPPASSCSQDTEVLPWTLGGSKGVYTFELNNATGEMTLKGITEHPDLVNPTYMCLDRTKKVNERVWRRRRGGR